MNAKIRISDGNADETYADVHSATEAAHIWYDDVARWHDHHGRPGCWDAYTDAIETADANEPEIEDVAALNRWLETFRTEMVRAIGVPEDQGFRLVATKEVRG